MINTRRYYLIYSNVVVFAILFTIAPILSVTAKNSSITSSDDIWKNDIGFVDKINYQVFSTEEEMIDALLNGTIDISGEFISTSSLKPEYYTNPNIEVSETTRRGFGQLTFQTQDFPTSVRGLRQAFSQAFDKESFINSGYSGNAYPEDSPVISSLGIWSCESEYATESCSSDGLNYHKANVELANTTVLNSGFYDFDGDGWREFFNGIIEYNGDIIWNGSAVRDDMNQRYTTNLRWNGYTWDTENDTIMRINFSQVNEILGGSALEYDDSGSNILRAGDLTNASNWEDISFTITSTSGGTVDTLITDASSAFASIGIKALGDFVPFDAFSNILNNGSFNIIFFVYAGMSPDPLFLELFTSTSVMNALRSRWYNTTFDQLWDIISNSSDFNTILDASYKAQQMLWQEQPMVVAYVRKMFTIYRTDKFTGHVNVLGEGPFVPISIDKIHLKDTAENRKNYPNWPMGGTLNYGMPQKMDSNNTLTSNHAYTLAIMNQIEEKLFELNPATGHYIGRIANSWTVTSPCSSDWSSDYSTECQAIWDSLNGTDWEPILTNEDFVGGSRYVIKINPDIKWHDGTALTAEDVAFSFQLIQNNNSPAFYDMISNIPTNKIKIIDNQTVVIYSVSPSYFEIGKMRVPIYQKKTWNNVSDPITFNPSPIGTGPYKLLSASDEEYALIRSEHYYKAPSKDATSTTTTTTSSNNEDSKTTDSISFAMFLISFVALAYFQLRNRRK